MLSNRITVETQRVNESLHRDTPLGIELDAAGRYVVLRPMLKQRDGTAVVIPIPIDKLHVMDYEPVRRRRGRRFRGFEHDVLDVLQELAVHLDVPVEVVYNGHDKRLIEPAPFEVPPIEENALPCIGGRFRKCVFRYSHESGRGIAGTFRFLLPIAEDGTICLGCSVESTFKLFIDGDGDLCLTTPAYKDEKLYIHFDLEDPNWGTDEVRGVYRYKYGRKPTSEKYGGNNLAAEILEIIRGSFRWSQDGLLVGWPSGHGDGRADSDRSAEDQEQERERERKRLFKLVPLPGLNAADLDLRDHARLTLKVQRTDFQRDATFDAFEQKFYGLAAEMWHQILVETDALPPTGTNSALLESLLRHATQPFRMQLESLIPQIGDERFRRRMHRHLGPVDDEERR